MSANEIWIIIIGGLVGVSCSILGVFVVLRKMSMLGDAISHSVLFGIVLAFLISSSRSPLIMLIGAGSVGLLTAYLTSALSRHGKLQEDASIGVTFTWLFALGVILISLYAGQIDLDQDCVLYGEIAFAPLDLVTISGYEVAPRAAVMLFFVTVLNILFVIIGYRNLKAISFDPVLATSLGINVSIWHYALMSFVSLTTVAAFESVGAILVVAMLVVPANAAYLLSKNLTQMIITAIFISILSSYLGFKLAEYYDASISASIVLMTGFFLILALIYEFIHKQIRIKTL